MSRAKAAADILYNAMMLSCASCFLGKKLPLLVVMVKITEYYI